MKELIRKAYALFDHLAFTGGYVGAAGYLRRYIEKNAAYWVGALTLQKATIAKSVKGRAAMTVAQGLSFVSGLVVSACTVGMGGFVGSALAAYIVQPLLSLASDKTFIEIEKRYIQWVDGFTSKYLSNLNLRALTGTPLAVLIEALRVVFTKIPACLRSSFLGAMIRERFKVKMEYLIGYDLKWDQIVKILLTHKNTIQTFLTTTANVNLSPIFEMVIDMVHDKDIDAVYRKVVQTARSFESYRPTKA